MTEQIQPISVEAVEPSTKKKVIITTQRLSAIPVELRNQIKPDQLRANKNCKKGCHGTGVWGYNTVNTENQPEMRTVEKEGKTFQVATGRLRRMPAIKGAEIHQPILCQCVTVVTTEVHENAPVKV